MDDNYEDTSRSGFGKGGDNGFGYRSSQDDDGMNPRARSGRNQDMDDEDEGEYRATPNGKSGGIASGTRERQSKTRQGSQSGARN